MPADISGLQAALLDQVVNVTADAADMMERDISLSAPIDTGALSRSGQVTTVPNGAGATATLTFTEEYASYQDDPPAGPIVGNPLLAFQWNGQTVIVHSVTVNPKNRGWFTDRATDDAMWSDFVQAAFDSTVIS